MNMKIEQDYPSSELKFDQNIFNEIYDNVSIAAEAIAPYWNERITSVWLRQLSVGLESNSKTLEILSNLQLISEHQFLPAWWNENNYKLFIPKGIVDAKLPAISAHPNVPLPTNTTLILNGKSNYSIMLWGNRSFLYVSQKSELPQGSLSIGDAFIYIGDRVRSAGQLNINCRNGGCVILENDILLANYVKLMSDDCHTIFDANSGVRINPYGGKILIRDHVWIGAHASIMGNSIINANNVVGESAFVRNIISPSGSILAGIPAKVIRTGISWDPNDLPPVGRA
jgi:acetyltransferase-like isoleucine patch superfamily enzyme